MVQPAWADEYSDANQLATERESAGKLDEAAEALETIAPQYPQDVELALRIAWLRFRATSYRKALRHYRDAQRLSPESVDAQLGIGWSLQRLGFCDDARPYFSELAAQKWALGWKLLPGWRRMKPMKPVAASLYLPPRSWVRAAS